MNALILFQFFAFKYDPYGFAPAVDSRGQPVLAVFVEALCGDAVHEACPCVGIQPFPCQPECPLQANLIDQAEPLVSSPPLSMAISVGSFQTPRSALWRCHKSSFAYLSPVGTGAEVSSRFMAFASQPSCRPSLHGHYPLLHYYSGSDFCPAPLARFPARAVLNASIYHLPCVPTPNIPNNPFLPSMRGVYEETDGALATGFATRSQARRCCKPNRVHFRLGPQVRLELLPTPSHEDAVASGCYPIARLGRLRLSLVDFIYVHSHGREPREGLGLH